jgi:hypothetical protein
VEAEAAARRKLALKVTPRMLTYLTAYLDACGRNGGNPLAGPDLERFLPWTADPGDLHAWAQPPRPG